MQNSNRKKAKINKNGLSVDYSREEIEQYLPNLADELHNNPINPIEIYGPNTEKKKLRTREEIEEITRSQYEENSELYFPKTEDFLRRCSSLEEAEDIIEHQLKMKEITESQAEELRELCKKYGVRFFGPKKEWGYYEKTYRK
ncbi:MAG: DUF2095 family protein [Candidatus Lokiarchaeota archaeon]|nr:DUF2095 family protein [Candidatus Lokiarchaeota archaeon]